MKYLSNDQIQESLEVLRPYNGFFSTTLLVLKKENAPVGSMMRFSLDAENRRFLEEHFRVHPKSRYFFRVMRQSDRAKDWLKPNYASTGLQAVNTQTFRDALLHEKNDNTWGWAKDYVEQLATKLPNRTRRIPLLHLAVWLYKYQEWDETVRRSDVVKRMIYDYNLSYEELGGLFLTVLDSNLTEEQAFQNEPVKWHELLAPYSRPADVPAETSGILTYLETASVGPALSVVFNPAQRLNLITGDNGLGKTFVLDLAWWALTQDWADLRATPSAFSETRRPLIRFMVEGTGQSGPVTARFAGGDWNVDADRSVLSGLVVYARLDGSFAIWDPANPFLTQSASNNWPGIKFTRDEVWDGKPDQIEGLIRDLLRWQQRPDRYPAFDTFLSVLRRVYPPDLGAFSFGEPDRIHNDPREIPTLVHPYGTVPILFESAGIRRIMTLAYLLVWVWEEHKIHARRQGKLEERQIVVLLDEAEAHLHPKWQRVILPGLLQVAQELHAEMSAQWIIASHSPLVMASVEGVWNTGSDRLFHLELDNSGIVNFAETEYVKRGTIDSWLSSDIFELPQPGSTEREAAIQNAVSLQVLQNPTKSAVEIATDELRKYLAAEDPFWIRWIFFAESFGVSP